MLLAEILDEVGDQIYLDDGYIMERADAAPQNQAVFHIKQLMDDMPLAYASIAVQPNEVNDIWMFLRNEAGYSIDYHMVSKMDAHNMLKFKWWVTNKMIVTGMLKSKVKKNAE